jgi:hypothetical protein
VNLLYRGERVGHAWEFRPKGRGRRRGKVKGAWNCGHRDLGVPEHGEEAADIEAAKTTCKFIVMMKSNPPPPAQE